MAESCEGVENKYRIYVKDGTLWTFFEFEGIKGGCLNHGVLLKQRFFEWDSLLSKNGVLAFLSYSIFYCDFAKIAVNWLIQFFIFFSYLEYWE